ncbi:DUF2271 domain-containing protein [Aminobacter sp. BA135]|uniref:DUF2271 domain-containing protein n=1 Tax=Aminobacter sp. BA135 TaxID=537596 RepID=UPI003D79BDF4
MYVTDPKGAYAGTLWMAGGKSKYYEHLSDWYRATRGNIAEINGITGASVGAGRKLEITLDLADALFDAGYTLHVDAAVEDNRAFRFCSAGRQTLTSYVPTTPGVALRQGQYSARRAPIAQIIFSGHHSSTNFSHKIRQM